MVKSDIRRKIITYKWRLQQLRSLYCEDTITKNRQYQDILIIKQKIKLLEAILEDNIENKERGKIR